MKRLGWLGALLIVLAFVPALQLRVLAGATRTSNVVPGEFLIKWKAGSSADQQVAAAQAQGGRIVDRIPALGIAAVRFDATVDGVRSAEDVIAAMGRSAVVEYIEPNYILSAFDQDQPDDTVQPNQLVNRQLLPLVLKIETFVPNDPGRTQQYAWDRIQAYKGWLLNQGSPNVIVAVVDTGVQRNHPDLAGKIAGGYDFVDNDNAADDGQGHGTHVAGTVGAMTNNGVGVAGTCPGCRIMPIRVLDNSGNGSLFNVANGIRYAADNGAKVINLSLGGPDASRTMESVVNYAWNKGALLACAAGNDGTSDTTNSYPAFYNNCLAVGATDSDDDDAYYSNWGTWVDIAAPGSNIYSTTIGSSYGFKDGTSMATPHVAGAAGLLMSQGYNNAQARHLLQTLSDPIDGTGLWWSNGRLNIFRALNGQ